MTQTQVKLFSRQNAEVTIIFQEDDRLTPAHVRIINRNVEVLLNAGFSPIKLSEDQIEQKIDVFSVARRLHSDGETPIIDYYSNHPRVTRRIFGQYLNTPEEIAAFETWSGLKLSSMTESDSENPYERGKKNADKYIVKLPHTFKIVFKINPKWIEWKEADQQGQEPKKRLFIRYEQSDQPAPDHTVKREVTPEPKKMTFEEACEVLSPGGAKFITLTDEQLRQIKDSSSDKVTPTMKEAAQIILKVKEK